MNEKCVRCGATQWLKADEILSDGKKLPKIEFVVHMMPNALIYKSPTQREVKPRFCGNCGAVEWFVENPQGLWKALNK